MAVNLADSDTTYEREERAVLRAIHFENCRQPAAAPRPEPVEGHTQEARQ